MDWRRVLSWVKINPIDEWLNGSSIYQISVEEEGSQAGAVRKARQYAKKSGATVVSVENSGWGMGVDPDWGDQTDYYLLTFRGTPLQLFKIAEMSTWGTPFEVLQYLLDYLHTFEDAKKPEFSKSDLSRWAKSKGK